MSLRAVDDPARCVIPASPAEEVLTGTPEVTEALDEERL